MHQSRPNWFLTSGARELKRRSALRYEDYLGLSQSCKSPHLEEDLHQLELDLSRIDESIRLFLLGPDDLRSTREPPDDVTRYEECPPHVIEHYVSILRMILTAYSVVCLFFMRQMGQIDDPAQGFCFSFALQRNPRVGYVQGHADVLCFLLRSVNEKRDEEETFWVYASVIERIFPEDFFARTPKLHGFQVDCKLYHELVVRKLVPHSPGLEKVDLPLVTTLLSCKWFVSLWVGEVPFSVLYEIWDAMFEEPGGTILHLVVALHFFQLAIDKIMLYMETEQWDSSYIYKIILNQCQNTTTISPQHLLQEACALYGLRDEFVEDVRAGLRRLPQLRNAEIAVLVKQTHFSQLELERLQDEFTFLRFHRKGCSRSKLRGLRQEDIEKIVAREYTTFLSVASRGTQEDKAHLLFQLVNQQHRNYLDQQGIEQLAGCSVAKSTWDCILEARIDSASDARLDLLSSLLANRMLADAGGSQVFKVWRNERLDFISGVAQCPLLQQQFRTKLQSIATSDGLLQSTRWIGYALMDSEIGHLMVWETNGRRSSGNRIKPRSLSFWSMAPIQPTLGRALSDSLLLHAPDTNDFRPNAASCLEKCGSGKDRQAKQLTLLSRKMSKKLKACWPPSTTDKLARNPFEEPSKVALYMVWCQCSIC
ncbi:hypothetical protein PsorP6_017200 [Peronosclerospora sorghi]|uniref:Uncharacterized protein n=1 Tax=Peronosclerospora sorghi TaxID=230839 RepID=A0ACC0WEH8_9STRA|nr:hypothetical protein PsorP6_017200 [Peronosclerospora sorghi]